MNASLPSLPISSPANIPPRSPSPNMKTVNDPFVTEGMKEPELHAASESMTAVGYYEEEPKHDFTAFPIPQHQPQPMIHPNAPPRDAQFDQANATLQQAMSEADALDCAAQGLEEAAARQTDRRVQRMLMRKAKKLRRKSLKMRGVHDRSIPKCIFGGLLMVATTPIYVSGAVVVGTGAILDAAAMFLKGSGRAMKKVHTWPAEKLGLI